MQGACPKEFFSREPRRNPSPHLRPSDKSVNQGGIGDNCNRDYCGGTDDLLTSFENKNCINLLSFNVCGINNRLLYPEFRLLLKCFDLICLTEI